MAISPITFPSLLTLTVWVKKADLVKASGKGHITNGSLVTTTRKMGRIPCGVTGKVVETGACSPSAAKAAVGSSAAHKVALSVPLAYCPNGAYFLGTDAVGAVWGGLLDGAWVYDDGDQPEKPGAFLSEADALAAARAHRALAAAA